jgi:hypothetical protein
MEGRKMRPARHTFRGFLRNIFDWYCDAALNLLKIRAVTLYVKLVKSVRLASLGLIGLWCGLLLMFAGFILAHIALLILIPVSMLVKSIILLILATIYMLVPFGILCYAFSERTWMKFSKASELVKDAVSS